MNSARCASCGWSSSHAAPDGATLFCEECGADISIEPAWMKTERMGLPINPATAWNSDAEKDARTHEDLSQPFIATPAYAESPAFSSQSSFPLELSFVFHYVLLAGARATCQYRLQNTSAEMVSRIRLTIQCDALKEGQVEARCDRLPSGAEDTDVVELKLSSDVHGPMLFKCQIEAGTNMGIRSAEGKLQGVIILPVTATGQDIRVHVGDNFALGAEGVNFNVGNASTDRDLLQRRFHDAPVRPVPLKERGSLFVEELPHHFINGLNMELIRVPVGTRNCWVCHQLVTQLNWYQVTGNQQEEQLRKRGTGHNGLHPCMPVYSINLTEAREFCSHLNRLELENGTLPPGYHYRLPTEAEWRAASGPVVYSDRELNHHAWTMLSKINGPQVVGTLKPNEFGLYDMRGNVFEWTDNSVEDTDKQAVYGGSWYADPKGSDLEAARNGSRILCPVTTRSSRIGMRIILAPRV